MSIDVIIFVRFVWISFGSSGFSSGFSSGSSVFLSGSSGFRPVCPVFGPSSGRPDFRPAVVRFVRISSCCRPVRPPPVRLFFRPPFFLLYSLKAKNYFKIHFLINFNCFIDCIKMLLYHHFYHMVSI